MKTFIKVLFVIHICVNFNSFASVESPVGDVVIQNDPITLEYEKCIANSQKKFSKVMNCAYNRYENADKALNEAYQQILLKGNLIDKKNFIDAQKAWLKYRDAELEFIDSSYSQPLRTAFKFVLIEQRVIELRSHLIDINKYLSK